MPTFLHIQVRQKGGGDSEYEKDKPEQVTGVNADEKLEGRY